MKRVGMLIDVTRCVGCYNCVDACAKVNDTGRYTPSSQDSIDGLAANRWTTILAKPDGRYVRKFCRHCLEPACVSVCLVGALQRTPEGPVVYDGSKCLGCRYCMTACPYGVPRYEWDSPAPLIRKCTLCYTRLQEGKLPGCVEACPTKTMLFGERDDMLAEAHRRIKAEPDKYLQKVYGEQEVGGTSVLYISDIPLDFLGYNGDPGDQPLPGLTWAVLSEVPLVGVGMMTLMGGIYWIIERRMKMMAAKNRSESR